MTPWGGNLRSYGQTGLNCGRQQKPWYDFILYDVPRDICTRISSFQDGGNGVFSNDLMGVSFKSGGATIGYVYTTRTPDYCRASNGGPVPDAIIQPTFGIAEAAAMCAQLDPNNRLTCILYSVM
jgi:hypothetical protein